MCCYLGLFAFRAWLVEEFGASVARVDEWEATGEKVLAAWRQGTFSVEALFQAHNGDHRIVATRLWEIFWYELNGSWDPKLIMAAKGGIYAAAAVIFIHLLAGALERRRYLAGGLLALLFAFPFGYQNLLWAFQSQFDFFLLMGALGWLALLSGRPVLALVVAALAPFTLGAGPIIAASYVPFFLAVGVLRQWPWRRAAGFAAVACALVLAGASLRGSHAAPLGQMGDQIGTLLKHLAWPYSNLVLLVDGLPESARLIPAAALNFPAPERSWLQAAATWLHAHPLALPVVHGLLAALMLAPIVVMLVSFWRRPPARWLAWGPLGLAAFAILLQVASAIARSSDRMVQTRYLDIVMLVGFAGAACAFVLWQREAWWRRAIVVWVLLLLPGYAATMGASWLRLNKKEPQLWLTAVQRYFPSHDRAVLPRNTAWQLPILEEDPTDFANRLDRPAVEAILPRAIVVPHEPPGRAARVAAWVGRFGLVFAGIAMAAATWIGVQARCGRREKGFLAPETTVQA